MRWPPIVRHRGEIVISVLLSSCTSGQSSTAASTTRGSRRFGEVRLSGDHDQGTFILSSLEHSVQAREFMGAHDPTKAALLVSIAALPGCSGIAGSTVTVEPNVSLSLGSVTHAGKITVKPAPISAVRST
jgi:hypothetical protein